MQDLFFTGSTIQCRTCQREFEIHRSFDPERIVLAMERIRHICRKPERSAIQTWHPSKNLHLYFSREMQRAGI